VLHRLEYFFPGEPTAATVVSAVVSGTAGPPELQRVFRALVDESRLVAAQPFVPPYDAELDEVLKRRGWHSRREEQWESHMFDAWTWPPTEIFAQPTTIHHEGDRLRVFGAVRSIRAIPPQLVLESRELLLTQIPYIEEWS
jgi:hypothetical protein